VTISKSFDNLENWRNEFLVQANITDHFNFPFVLIGNKIDQEDQRAVCSTSSLGRFTIRDVLAHTARLIDWRVDYCQASTVLVSIQQFDTVLRNLCQNCHQCRSSIPCCCQVWHGPCSYRANVCRSLARSLFLCLSCFAQLMTTELMHVGGVVFPFKKSISRANHQAPMAVVVANQISFRRLAATFAVAAGEPHQWPLVAIHPPITTITQAIPCRVHTPADFGYTCRSSSCLLLQWCGSRHCLVHWSVLREHESTRLYIVISNKTTTNTNTYSISRTPFDATMYLHAAMCHHHHHHHYHYQQ
jgi:hypothetical protein